MGKVGKASSRCVRKWKRKSDGDRDRHANRRRGYKGESSAPVFRRDRPSEEVGRESVHVCVEGYRRGVQVA